MPFFDPLAEEVLDALPDRLWLDFFSFVGLVAKFHDLVVNVDLVYSVFHTGFVNDVHEHVAFFQDERFIVVFLVHEYSGFAKAFVEIPVAV